MSKKEIKKCIDCGWCQLDLADPENSLCINPEVAEVSLVTGKPEGPFRCSTRRLYPCGKDAKFFEPHTSEKPEEPEEEKEEDLWEDLWSKSVRKWFGGV